jgi:RHH-type rel operon transcriptional repressor/antitoxin RelB
MNSTTLTIRMDEKTKERLDRLAKSLDRSKSFIASHAIEDYLEVNEWQMQEIAAGMREAEAGRIIGHENVKAKWEARLENPMVKRGGKKPGRG